MSKVIPGGAGSDDGDVRRRVEGWKWIERIRTETPLSSRRPWQNGPEKLVPGKAEELMEWPSHAQGSVLQNDNPPPACSCPILPSPTPFALPCLILRATLTMSCSSLPVPRKRSGREGNKTRLPNGARPSKLSFHFDNPFCSLTLP